VAAAAAARREALALRIVEAVRRDGGPIMRRDLSVALDVANGGTLQDALGIAVERAGLYVAGGGSAKGTVRVLAVEGRIRCRTRGPRSGIVEAGRKRLPRAKKWYAVWG
jgi:hypothetical protein